MIYISEHIIRRCRQCDLGLWSQFSTEVGFWEGVLHFFFLMLPKKRIERVVWSCRKCGTLNAITVEMKLRKGRFHEHDT